MRKQGVLPLRPRSFRTQSAVMEARQVEDLLRRHLLELQQAIISPDSLSIKLFSRTLISRDVFDAAGDGSIPKEDRRSAICREVFKSVAVNATRLVEFVEVASDHSPVMGDVCAKIKQEPLYGEHLNTSADRGAK